MSGHKESSSLTDAGCFRAPKVCPDRTRMSIESEKRQSTPSLIVTDRPLFALAARAQIYSSKRLNFGVFIASYQHLEVAVDARKPEEVGLIRSWSNSFTR